MLVKKEHFLTVGCDSYQRDLEYTYNSEIFPLESACSVQ